MSDLVGDNNVGSSPEPVVENDSVDSVGSGANEPAMSPREFLTRRQELRNKASAKMTDTSEPESDAQAKGEEESEDTGSQPDKAELKNDKEKQVNGKFQQRIDKLTARYHEAERKAAEKDVQIEKLMKATEILQKELQRVSQTARLDPKEEKIRELEYRKEIDDFTRGLNTRQEEIYNQSVSEYAVQTRADQILDEVNELVQEYDLVSPEEILFAMRDRGMTATQAAREIHNSRLQKAQKRMQTAKHPASVSKKGSESISPVDEPYRGTETIKNYFLKRLAERNGVAE